MRPCQPSPVDLKYHTTSGLYRTETRSFLFADFGRPRRARIGTIDRSWLGVRGLASGSALAAAVIALSSATVGSAIARRLGIFDIVFHLSAIGTTQADDPADRATINKSHVVENSRLWRNRDHPYLFVFEAGVDPHQRSVPIEFFRQCQRDAMLLSVARILGWIERDSHCLL